MTKETTNNTRKTTKMIFAMPTAVPAMPPKPRIAAMSAMMRKVRAQDNTVIGSFSWEVEVTVHSMNRAVLGGWM
jgi:hypothetical protein